MSKTAVAIVEDEILLALDLECLCQDLGCEVLGIARSEAEARIRFSGLRIDMLITDLELGDGPDGADAAAFLRHTNPSMEIVFVTGAHAPEKIRRMEALSPKKILRKPVRLEELKSAILNVEA